MECWRALFSGFFLLLWGLSVSVDALPPCEFPAVYNFGDSNSDTGSSSAAFTPFPAPNAPGRACDGLLIIDFIAEHLKLPYLSAYLDSLGANFRHGANFATGQSTIRRPNKSFFELGISPFSLDVQIEQFNQFKARSKHIYEEAEITSDRDKLPRQEDFVKALYTFDIGEIDLAFGFRAMSLDQLLVEMPHIINRLALAVQSIYQRGGRAFWIHNTRPIGCLPGSFFYIISPEKGFLDEIGCIKAKNDMAVEFNRQLKETVIKLRVELPEAAIAYVDVYAATYELTSSAKDLGYEDPFKFCCGYYDNTTYVGCGKKAIINNTEVYGASCKDPSKFISWDGVHFSEAANKWVANRVLNGSLTDPPIQITKACHRQ